MPYLIAFLAAVAAVFCLISVGVAVVYWAQLWIVTHGLLTVTWVSAVGVVVFGLGSLIAFEMGGAD